MLCVTLQTQNYLDKHVDWDLYDSDRKVIQFEKCLSLQRRVVAGQLVLFITAFTQMPQ